LLDIGWIFGAAAESGSSSAFAGKGRKRKDMELKSGLVSGVSAWDIGVVEPELEPEPDFTPPKSREALLEEKEVEGERCFKNLVGAAMNINWAPLIAGLAFKDPEHHSCVQDPDEPDPDTLDVVDDLMKVNVSKAYSDLQKADPLQTKFGWLLLMATCSKGNIGAMNAESYAERVISQANLVMTNGNTLLSDEELEWLVVLRMNRDFMDYMRSHFKHLVMNQFKMTVVSEERMIEVDLVECKPRLASISEQLYESVLMN
jgi:hypothetical protein